MKKSHTITSTLTSLIMFLTAFSSLAQSSGDRDCEALYTMIREGQEWFGGYTGEQISSAGNIRVLEYRFSLWNSDRGELRTENKNMSVNFYYPSFSEQDIATEFFGRMVNAVTGCLGENYYLSRDGAGNFLLYHMYTDARDSDSKEFFIHPRIILSLEEYQGRYLVIMSVLASDD
jgi:hypothetical protein